MKLRDNFQRNLEVNISNDKMDFIGSVQLFGASIPVGQKSDDFYLLHSQTGEIVCKLVKVGDFIHKNRVIWAKIASDNELEMMINQRGTYLIDIRTSNYIDSNRPDNIEGNTFITAGEKIQWNEYDFEILSEDDNKDHSSNDKGEDSEEIKEFLEEIELKFGKPPDRIDDVRAEVPLVEIFNSLGDGDMDDGDFIPPSQSEYADFGYIILKNNASSENAHMFSEEYRKDWKGRLRRTWPSLVRDAHFSTKINQESDDFDAVSDGIEKDLKGADSVIVNNGTEYHINLFVDSEKSKKYFNHKKENRQDKDIMMEDMAEDGPINIAVTTDIKNGSASDTIQSSNNREIYLYSDEHINAVKKLIKSDKNKIEDKNGNTLCEISE
jgi:hypothetical protein